MITGFLSFKGTFTINDKEEKFDFVIEYPEPNNNELGKAFLAKKLNATKADFTVKGEITVSGMHIKVDEHIII